MKEAQIKSVALFYYYTFLDKSLALKAAAEAVHLIEKNLKKRDEKESDSLLVYCIYKVWKKYSKK